MFQRRKRIQSTNKENTPNELPTWKALPPNFAEMVIQMEMDITYQWNIHQVKQLIALYSEGIEYYEWLSDVRYLQYQDRLQKLLMRPDIVAVMKEGNKSTPKISTDILKTKQEEFNKNRQQKWRRQSSCSSFMKQERSAQHIVLSNCDQAKNSSQQVKNDLAQQADSLKQRVRKRSISRSQERAKSIDDTKYSKSQAQYEASFEKLNILFYNKKNMVTAWIRQRFESQIQEISKESGPIVDQIVAQLQLQMEEQLMQEVVKIEKEKKIAVRRLKAK